MNRELETVLSEKIVAIVRGVYGEDVLRLAEALKEGGIRLMEITFDQASDPMKTVEAIRLLERNFVGEILPGAGTVMTKEQVTMACEAGAKYIISPNVDEGVISATKELGLLSMPGAMTPTEIAAAYGMGADIVKLFPASALGVSYLRAVKAPLSHIPIMAVGGIDENNAGDFIRAGAAGIGAGGKLVNKALIQDGKFDLITETAKKLSESVFAAANL